MEVLISSIKIKKKKHGPRVFKIRVRMAVAGHPFTPAPGRQRLCESQASLVYTARKQIRLVNFKETKVTGLKMCIANVTA